MTYAAIDGHPVTTLRLHVPARGVWYLEADMIEAPELAGAVTVTVGAVELRGTVDARSSGTHGLQRRTRVVGGAGAWGSLLPAKAYHSDAGVRALLIAQDAAREAGETLGGFEPEADQVGIDYVRQLGPASRILEDAIGAAIWWVDYDGRTQVGTRAESDADPGAYEVLEHNPRDRVVTLAVDDLTAVGIGSRLTSDLDEPQTVRELDVEVSSDSVRVRAWTGGEASSRGRIVDALRGFVRRSVDERLHGLFRYRVVRMSSDRVELQAVRARPGLPDVLPISMWPGVAGAHAEPTPSAEVLVQFIEGDRTLPVVTHFAGKDGVGWAPVNLTIDVEALMKLGAGAAEFVALADKVKARLDSIQSTFDAHTHPVGTLLDSTAGACTGATAVPASPIGALASVAASKVKAE